MEVSNRGLASGWWPGFLRGDIRTAVARDVPRVVGGSLWRHSHRLVSPRGREAGERAVRATQGRRLRRQPRRPRRVPLDRKILSDNDPARPVPFDIQPPARGEACTLAAHNTVRAGMTSPAKTHAFGGDVLDLRIEAGESVTPSLRRAVVASIDRAGGKAGNKRGADRAPRTTVALAGSIARNSRSRPWRASSTIAPASSTPVGPPPAAITNDHPCRALCWIICAFGPFERREQPASDLDCVFNRLEARSILGPVVHAEIAAAAPVARTR